MKTADFHSTSQSLSPLFTVYLFNKHFLVTLLCDELEMVSDVSQMCSLIKVPVEQAGLSNTN